MDPYSKLDDETLCFTLIGQFMYHWSILENAVDQALGNALNLSYMQMTVLSDHIKFVEKLRILTGAITLATFDVAQRKSFHATIDSLLPLYRDRNIVAHHQFGPLPGKRGVTFFTRQTKKTIKLNEEFWSEGECIARFETLNKAAEAIHDLSKNLEKEKASLASLFVLNHSYGAKRELNEERGSWLNMLRGHGWPEEGDEHSNDTER
ncbi:hypothetical protein [Ensifer sp. YR511]|uniref:hypothetical protein n=1 Tax=Ensifer sp. YR511 TaxID=1855294 RepID=UPI00088E320E|nr:hypothetical protein [Ensifer sp. YR511]SDM28588.1 hypothetical protein SAMN05216328_107282 [Ensifer sp. YR511]